MKRFAIAVLSLYLPMGAASAHDFWIEPSSFRPGVGELLAVRLRVGENLAGDPVERNSVRIERFFILGPDGEKPLVGRDGDDPAGLGRIERSGLYLIGYRSNRSALELDAPKFEQYLREEGLENIIAARAARGDSNKSGREVYSRCAKSLLSTGEEPAPGHDRLVGFTLELVPEVSPYRLKPGQALPLRLLYQGRPVEGVLVVALGRSAPGEKVSARTDRNGRVLLVLPREGLWLVKAVHMIPAPEDTLADWESLWASLTFEIKF